MLVLITNKVRAMKRFFTPSLLVVTLLIVGCSSLNNSFNSYFVYPSTAHAQTPVTETTMPEIVAEATISNVEKEPEFNCPPFEYEFTGKPPEIPEDKIKAAGDDIYEIERIERQHIKELRAHMAKMQRRLKYAMSQHEVKCRMAGAQ